MSTHPKVRGKKIPPEAGIVCLTGDFFLPDSAVGPRSGRAHRRRPAIEAFVPSRSGRESRATRDLCP
jgi:hypothetical protein